MKRARISACALLAAGLVASFGAAAADLYVIANPTVALAPADVRDVYLGEKQFSGSLKLHPVDNAAAQDRFLSAVMHMSSAAYTTTWTKKAFRQGLTQPPRQATNAEVLDYVRRTEGAVGYVTSAPSGVKIVQKIAD